MAWMPWLVVALGLLAFGAPLAKIPMDQADSAGMLAHLHAVGIDGDLVYDNEYAALRMSPLFAFVTAEGWVSNHWPMGATWLQLPGFMLGQGATRWLAATGVGKAAPMGLTVLLAVRAWAVVVIGGAMIPIVRFVGGPDRRSRMVTAAALVLGTPLLYYVSEAPLRPHAWGFVLTAAVVWVWSRSNLGGPIARPLLLGSLCGLATFIRPQLAPLFLLCVHDAWPRPSRSRATIWAFVAFIPWPLAHLRVQAWMYGPALSDYGGPVSHHLGQFLFSAYHGVLPWCPVFVIGAVALGHSVAKRHRGAWLLLALVALQIWLDSGLRSITAGSVLGTRTWAGGVAFGPRKLLDAAPLLFPAVIALRTWACAQGRGRTLAALVVAAIVPTAVLHAAAFVDPERTTGLIHDGPSLVATMGEAFDPAAWAAAWRVRALPGVVAVTVTAAVTLPALLSVAAVVWAARRLDPARRVIGAAAVVLGVGALAHGWLGWAMARSEAVVAADPDRIPTAAARLNPAHRAAVARIPAAMQQLRKRLGPGAAPPPASGDR